jgi:hypothetical protein
MPLSTKSLSPSKVRLKTLRSKKVFAKLADALVKSIAWLP